MAEYQIQPVNLLPTATDAEAKQGKVIIAVGNQAKQALPSQIAEAPGQHGVPVINLSTMGLTFDSFLNDPANWTQYLGQNGTGLVWLCHGSNQGILILNMAGLAFTQWFFCGTPTAMSADGMSLGNAHSTQHSSLITRIRSPLGAWSPWKYVYKGNDNLYDKISGLDLEIPQATDTTLGGIKANAAQTKGFSVDITPQGFLTVPIPHAAGNNLGLVSAKPKTKTDTKEVTVDEAGKLYYSETEMPVIPTISNHTITTKQGGIVKGQFTLNQNDSAEINLDWVDLTGNYDYDYPWDIASDEENTMKIALIQELLQVLRDEGFETDEFNPCTIRVLHSNGCSSTMIIKTEESTVTQWFYGQFRIEEIIGQTNVLYSDPSKPYALYKRSGGIADIFGAWEQVNIIKSLMNTQVPSDCDCAAKTAQEVSMGAAAFTTTQTVGGLPSGTVINPTDNLYTILKRILRPTALPTLTLAGSNPAAGNVEIGTNITPTLTPTWTQRDGGTLNIYSLFRNNIKIHEGYNATAWQAQSFQLIETTTFFAEVNYEANSETGVAAGVVKSGNVAYTPRRRAFMGALNNTNIPNTSNIIRALTGGVLNPANGTTLVASTAIGSTGICFAYPATLRDATSIIQTGVGNVLSAFTKITVSVQGANNYTAENYKVYYSISEFPFGGAETFTLTI